MSLRDKFDSLIKVRINVPDTDTRNFLCGSPVQSDAEGRFFVVPAHQADYIGTMFPGYEVGEEYEDKPVKKAGAK